MHKSQSALIVRLPPRLHQQLKDRARRAGVSLNHYCRALLHPAQPPTTEKLAIESSLRTESKGGLPNPQTLIGEILSEFGDEIEGVIWFGSWVRGQADSSSDIDLLVVFAAHTEISRDLYDRWRPGKLSGHEVSPLFVGLPDLEDELRGLWLEVALEGVVLFDRDLKVNRYLAHARGLIGAGKVRRLMTHGHPYWVHQGNTVSAGTKEDEHEK